MNLRHHLCLLLFSHCHTLVQQIINKLIPGLLVYQLMSKWDDSIWGLNLFCQWMCHTKHIRRETWLKHIFYKEKAFVLLRESSNVFQIYLQLIWGLSRAGTDRCDYNSRTPYGPEQVTPADTVWCPAGCLRGVEAHHMAAWQLSPQLTSNTCAGDNYNGPD